MTISDLPAPVTDERWMAKYTDGERPTAGDIAGLAYYFYETRARQNGHDVEDWLLAEHELMRHYWLVADQT